MGQGPKSRTFQIHQKAKPPLLLSTQQPVPRMDKSKERIWTELQISRGQNNLYSPEQSK